MAYKYSIPDCATSKTYPGQKAGRDFLSLSKHLTNVTEMVSVVLCTFKHYVFWKPEAPHTGKSYLLWHQCALPHIAVWISVLGNSDRLDARFLSPTHGTFRIRTKQLYGLSWCLTIQLMMMMMLKMV